MPTTGRAAGAGSRIPGGPGPAPGNASRQAERLSAEGWFKRWYDRAEFASTRSIARERYRRDLLGHSSALADELRALHHAIGRLPRGICRTLTVHPRVPDLPSGLRQLARVDASWFAPDRWNADVLARERGAIDRELIDAGREETNRLRKAAAELGVKLPPPYLAVVVQDVDRMGRHLSAMADLETHRRISAALSAAAEKQRTIVEPPEMAGSVVYTGGDDLLCLVPASTALRVARAAREVIDDTVTSVVRGSSARRITASTAVVFFHYSHPLQHAISQAHEALAAAKEAGRPSLVVVSLKGGGVRDWVLTGPRCSTQYVRSTGVFEPAQIANSGTRELDTAVGTERRLPGSRGSRDGCALMGRLVAMGRFAFQHFMAGGRRPGG